MRAKEWGLARTDHGSSMNPLTPTPKMNESEENVGFSFSCLCHPNIVYYGVHCLYDLNLTP